MEDKEYLLEFQKLDDETRDLIKNYDENIYENKITDGKKDLLYQICEKLQNEGSPLKEFFEKEIFVCGSRCIMGYFYSEEFLKKNIPNDYISWYIFREKQVMHNFLLRAKYCWIIFNLDKSKHEYARRLKRYCKYITVIYIGNKWISPQHFQTNHLIIECVKIALECVHYLKDRDNNENLLKYVISLLKHISSDQNLFILYEISDNLVDDLKYYNEVYKNELASHFINLYNNYASDIRFYDRIENILNKLIKIFKSDTLKVKCLKNRIARVYVKFGKLANSLQSYFYYEKAARIYQEIGEHKKKDRALRLMGKINPVDYMTKLSFNLDLSELTKEIIEKTENFLEEKKSIKDIKSYIEIPSINIIIKSEDHTSILDLFQTTVFSSGSSTRFKPEDIETGKKKIYNIYQVYLNTYLLVKSQFYKSLIEQNIFKVNNLDIFFKSCNLDADLCMYLLEGIKFFILSQYHAALFILIPQIETIIKKIAEEKAGIPIKKTVLDGEQDKTLGGYFSDEKFESVLGPDFNTYCFWFLADKTGLNLRNNVAHGQIKFQEVQNHLLIGIIEIIFLLIEIIK